MGIRIKKLRENECARRKEDHNINDIIYMVATHFVQMECWHNSPAAAASDIWAGTDATFFSIHFLSI